MDLAGSLLVAIGLAMDSLATSVASGAQMGRARPWMAARAAASFGGFQAGMPVIGWLLAGRLTGLTDKVDHWLAFGLLGFIGARMIWEGLRGKVDTAPGSDLDAKTLVVLSVATSIDALMVGASFAWLGVEIARPAVMIGVVTFILSFAGLLVGGSLGRAFGGRVQILGGLILFGIGSRILMEHLGLAGA